MQVEFHHGLLGPPSRTRDGARAILRVLLASALLTVFAVEPVAAIDPAVEPVAAIDPAIEPVAKSETEAAPEEEAEATLGPGIWSTGTHVRPLGSRAAELLAEARSRSATVAKLLADLERTDVVVYLTDMMPLRNGGPRSNLRFLSAAGGTRYLVARIDRWRVSGGERIALLGHELQHALEVAAAPEVRASVGLAQLYRRIGWEAERGQYETEAARAAGFQVWRDLSGRSR